MLKPSEVDEHLSWFDRFAGGASRVVSRAPFFAFCVLLILLWAPSILVFDVDTWQLVINTATTIITFLLVALLQNSQERSDRALQQKLNAIAEALAELVDADEELRAAVGLEDRESSS